MALRIVKGGIGAIQEESSGKSFVRNFVPFFNLKKGEIAFVQFKTAITEDTPPSFPFHRFVKVKRKDKDGKLVDGYADFACRKNAAWEDENPNLACVLCDEMGHEAEEKFAGIAVLLEPEYKKGSVKKTLSDIASFNIQGRTAENREGDDVFYPDYQIVWQGKKNFWGPLVQADSNYGEIHTTPYSIMRIGDSTDTTYQFSAITHAAPIDWSPYEEGIPAIMDVIEGLGSKERYDEYFADKSKRLEQFQKYAPSKRNRDDDGDSDSSDNGEAAEPAQGSGALSRLESQIKGRKAKDKVGSY